jgi:hypothetical protein
VSTFRSFPITHRATGNQLAGAFPRVWLMPCDQSQIGKESVGAHNWAQPKRHLLACAWVGCFCISQGMLHRSARRSLAQPHCGMGSVSKRYETGMVVPETGVYRVAHAAHRLPHQAVLLRAERFPRCAICGDAVLFELAYAAPDLFTGPPYKVYELPVIEEDAAAPPA